MLGSTLRADVDVFNTTNFYTENLFGLWVAQDLDDPTHYSPFLLQGGLGMPDRSYYVDSSSAMATIRGKYRQHVAAMLGLAKVADADAKAKTIVDLETRIATVHLSREESGDVTKGNNHWARADFAAKAPGLDWDAYFAAAGLGKATRFVVWQPSAITGICRAGGERAARDVEGVSDLPRHPVARGRAARRASATSRSPSSGTVLTGATKPRDRWKRAVSATNAALGFAVGRLYAERYFPPAEKARAQAMVDEHHRRLPRADRPARLDGAGDEGGGQGQARRAQGRRRLSRLLAGLLRARGVSRRRIRQRGARASCSSSTRHSPSWASRWTAASGS